MGRGRSKFSPAMVPEVRNGFFWVPGQRVSGLGTTAFRWEEGNQKSVADQIQTTVAKQPAQIVSNGIPVWSVVGAVDVPGSDIRLTTTGNVTAGFGSGDNYFAMWQRWPGVGVANGLPSGVTTIFRHEILGAGTRRINLTHNGVTEQYALTVSPDGTTTQINTWDATVDYPDPTSPNLYLWKEWIMTAGVGATMFVNFTLRATVSAAITSGVLFDVAAPIALYSSTSVAVNQNVSQYGLVAYCPGVPSLKNRKRLANIFNPAGTKFSI